MKAKRFAAFVWHSDPNYYIDDAVKLFVNEKVADKWVRAEYEKGRAYVVRDLKYVRPGKYKANPSMRGKTLKQLTIDQLQILALRAFPSSPRQIEIQAEIKKRLARGEKFYFPAEKPRKSNPRSRVQGGERLEMIQAAQAAKLYERFTGHGGATIAKVPQPKHYKAVAVIGEIDGIMYSTVRDGVLEKYIHKFKKSARPLFCVSPDGKQILLIGGEYNFTERGIIDKT